MSVSGALFNALSGLTASSRAIQVVSTNVSNAMTDGFARRELSLSSRSIAGFGNGVVVDGVRRNVDMQVVSELRNADAEAAGSSERQAFLQRVQNIFGLADDDGSLVGRFAQFEATLIEASSRPDSSARLQAVITSARAITAQLNRGSDQIQELRRGAEDQIDALVTGLNANLQRVADLNATIRNYVSGGRDVSGLMDDRQRIIDQIATVIPIKEVQRDFGQVALYAPGGAALLDGLASEFSFDRAGVITPDMEIGSPLSGLSLNGKPITNLGEGGKIGGGRLSALFDIRDNLATDAQSRLDAIARDLTERFNDPTLDPTITAGLPGLFTDAGAEFQATDERGLAARIALNAAVDPDQGGDLWKLRDGLYATAMGNAGDGALISAMASRLTEQRAAISGSMAGVSFSAAGLAGEHASLWNADLANSEKELGFAGSRAAALRTLYLQDGVDTDQEMQQLLVIERAYAANAKVISTVDDLLQTLLGM